MHIKHLNRFSGLRIYYQSLQWRSMRSTHAYMLSCFSRVWLSVTPWTIAHQASLSMGFSRQEYWSGLPCPSRGHLPNPGIEPASLTSPALAGGFFTTSTTIHNVKWSWGTGKDWTNYGMLSYINHPYLYIQHIYHGHWMIIIYRPLQSCLL